MQITEGQVNAGLRHVGTAAGTTVAVFTVLGMLSADQAAGVLAGVHEMTDGLQHVFGGASKVLYIVGPIAMVWMGKIAVGSASIQSQAKSLFAAASGPTTPKTNEATAAILNAASSLPQVNPDVRIEGKIIASAEVAAAVPSDKVVSR